MHLLQQRRTLRAHRCRRRRRPASSPATTASPSLCQRAGSTSTATRPIGCCGCQNAFGSAAWPGGSLLLLLLLLLPLLPRLSQQLSVAVGVADLNGASAPPGITLCTIVATQGTTLPLPLLSCAPPLAGAAAAALLALGLRRRGVWVGAWVALLLRCIMCQKLSCSQRTDTPTISASSSNE